MGTVLNGWNEPALVQQKEDGGSWAGIVFLEPELDVYPACASLNAQICGGAAREWQEAFEGDTETLEDVTTQSSKDSSGCASSRTPTGVLVAIGLTFLWFLLRRRPSNSEV